MQKAPISSDKCKINFVYEFVFSDSLSRFESSGYNSHESRSASRGGDTSHASSNAAVHASFSPSHEANWKGRGERGGGGGGVVAEGVGGPSHAANSAIHASFSPGHDSERTNFADQGSFSPGRDTSRTNALNQNSFPSCDATYAANRDSFMPRNASLVTIPSTFTPNSTLSTTFAYTQPRDLPLYKSQTAGNNPFQDTSKQNAVSATSNPDAATFSSHSPNHSSSIPLENFNQPFAKPPVMNYHSSQWNVAETKTDSTDQSLGFPFHKTILDQPPVQKSSLWNGISKNSVGSGDGTGNAENGKRGNTQEDTETSWPKNENLEIQVSNYIGRVDNNSVKKT